MARSNDPEATTSPPTIVQKVAVDLTVMTIIPNTRERATSLPTIAQKVVPNITTTAIKSNALEATTFPAISTWFGAHTYPNKAREKGARGEIDLMMIERPHHPLQSNMTILRPSIDKDVGHSDG